MSINIHSSIKNAPQEVIAAIKNASEKTGVNFDYLVNQARTESSFRTDVKASTSSATGLYQFIDQTWLGTVSKHGSKHGLGELSNYIKKDYQGRFFVTDDAKKTEILNLRKDADISALMAAEFAADNQKTLQSKTDKDITATDLYFAHFLGAGGASQFINAMENNPNGSAATILPKAASANKNIFYNSDGSMKSFNEVYKNFQAKIEGGTPIQVAEIETFTPMTKETNLYRKDVQFERMYGENVADMISALPQMTGLKASDYFEIAQANNISNLMQKSLSNQSLFLTMTMLDEPA